LTMMTKFSLSPNKQHGPRRSTTECDRKQGRSKPTVHTRRDRRSGERRTCREKVKEVSLQKGMSFWKIKKSKFTVDWFLREGQGRELLGEWMKVTSVRSQDQRRMLRANSHAFPTNTWIHKITKGKESDRCDLCRVLWIVEDRFRTEKDLPEQTLGHIQHTCEALSATHIDTHHQCWRMVHGKLVRVTIPEWKFL
jgi:hypothetical protein